MNKMLQFYKRTWWIWSLFVIFIAVAATYVTPLYWIALPGLVLYSVYFATVRRIER